MKREALKGGVGNAGAVFREGDHVLRPTNPHTSTVHSLLDHLHQVGFGGAPYVVGIERVDGGVPSDMVFGESKPSTFAGGGLVERLEFLDGDVPVPPFPVWSQSDAVLGSIAALMRVFHDATVGFVAHDGATWSDELVDPQGRSDSGHGGAKEVHRDSEDLVICHNDICPENVVFRDGVAVALLDFDFAAPGRRVWDVACMARMCVPVETDEDAARTGRRGLDPVSRLRVVADAYGLKGPERTELVDVLSHQFEGDGTFVKRRVDAGEPAFIEMWEAMGGQQRLDRRRRWFAAERPRFLAAMRGEPPS